MQVKSIGQNIGSVEKNNKRIENIQPQTKHVHAGNDVAFTGALKAPNKIVWLMDFIAAGGYAASFCIQDGLGFIAPRVGKGLFRGGKKKHDENGNEILDKNGQPKRELNWAYARKEGIREIITGPSAFLIPWLLLKGINKKFGTGNSVKLDYLDGFKPIFTDYAKANIADIKNGNADKKIFYKEVFKNILNQSINEQPNSVKIKNLDKLAEKYAEKLDKIENINEKYKGIFKNKKGQSEELAQIGSIEDDFMKLRKSHVGGAASDTAISILSSDGKVKNGSISELTKAMTNYFDDAVKNVHNEIAKAKNANLTEVIEKFTSRRMGTRILTNLGLFASVALFYTQIPKLYNMGTGGKNPALMNDEEPALQTHAAGKSDDTENNKQVSFGSSYSLLEKAGDKVIGNSTMKKVSDIFELNGPIIQGNAMAVLLYGACIPPRLIHAQDKYDYTEILARDMTAFTALLFGAKALSRLFSDGFTKLTGLALNNKNLNGRSFVQKVWDYLNPSDGRHSILSSKELDSKYTNLRLYKNGIDGFVDFIEKSGGNIKKAFANDKNIKNAINELLVEAGTTFDKASSDVIKKVLHEVNTKTPKKLDNLYKLFDGPNKLLNRAKTCNSFFGALSTLFLVPFLIYKLTDICKAMTDKRKAEENRIKNQTQAQQAPLIPSSRPTMAGFINKSAL